MTTDTNRETVLRFCDSLSRRDFSGMAALVTPDATWWVVGRPDYAPYGGLRPVAEVLQLIDTVLGSLDEFTFSVDGSIAEGDRIAIEATSSGRQGTILYNNVYLMRYQLRDGKILSIREFMDGYEISAFFGQLGLAGGEPFANLESDEKIG